MLLLRSLKAASLFALIFMVGCQQGALDLPGASTTSKTRPAVQPSNIQQNPVLTPTVKGEKIGTGALRVALLVPSSAGGGGGVVAKQIANAAKLAMRDFGANRFQLVIKDTEGQASTAQALTTEAIQEGASLILGPLFSGNVSSSSAISVPSKRPMIAFSSDTNRARAGVYLLSFAPQADISRTLNYGIGQGANRIVAILPKGSYGNLAEREARRVAAATGATITAVTRYSPDAKSIDAAARLIAVQVNESNALYIPDGGAIPALVIKSLRKAGVKFNGHVILGSGQWESVNKKDPVLEGAIYAGADKREFVGFASRYKTTYGSDPSATAALGYDAVSLAAELVRRTPLKPFSAQAIQSPSGFRGVTGLFRFRANGSLQRGLVVNQIRGGQSVIVSPSPQSFGPNG